MVEALKVLDKVAALYGHTFNFTEALGASELGAAP